VCEGNDIRAQATPFQKIERINVDGWRADPNVPLLEADKIVGKSVEGRRAVKVSVTVAAHGSKVHFVETVHRRVGRTEGEQQLIPERPSLRRTGASNR
jgi:hypothetical protein